MGLGCPCDGAGGCRLERAATCGEKVVVLDALESEGVNDLGARDSKGVDDLGARDSEGVDDLDVRGRGGADGLAEDDCAEREICASSSSKTSLSEPSSDGSESDIDPE